MIRLIHGTAAERLPMILSEGLQPRGNSKATHEHVPSHPDRVYLSESYGLHYAGQATDGDRLLVEVEVCKSKLWADEDFLAQARTEWSDTITDRAERVLFFRDHMHEYYDRATIAAMSLERMGSVAHEGPIPVSAITRYVTIPAADAEAFIWQGYDPSATILNYRVMGVEQRAFHQKLFEDYINP